MLSYYFTPCLRLTKASTLLSTRFPVSTQQVSDTFGTVCTMTAMTTETAMTMMIMATMRKLEVVHKKLKLVRSHKTSELLVLGSWKLSD